MIGKQNFLIKLLNLTVASVLMLSLLSGCTPKTLTLSTLDDLSDKRIGVYVGTIYDKFATERFPSATIMQYNGQADLVLAIKTEKIDAAITNLAAARNMIAANPEIGILTDKVLNFSVGFGFNKGNPQLRQRFNDFLAGIRQDGSLDAMYKKWFEGDANQVQIPKFEGNPSGEKLVVGVAVGDMPSVGYVDGQYVGFDIELLQTFAQSENINLEIVSMEFGSLVAALASGKVDIIADCVAITEERQKQVDFSDPYMEDKSAVIALTKNIAQSQAVTMDDVAKGRVGVLLGTVYDTYLSKNYPETEVLQYKNYPDLILAVQSKKVDSGFINCQAFKELQKENPFLVLLVDDVFSNPVGVGFNKENSALREQFNQFLAEIKSNGVYDDWYKRWFKDGSHAMPVVENAKTNGKLVVGMVSDKGWPFTVIENNQMVGSDVELVQRFGAYLNREVEYSDMEFGSLIAAVSTDKVEMIVSTIMITDERKKQIDFSDPYFELSACVMGAKEETAATEKPSFFQGISDSFYNNIIAENRYLLIVDGIKTTALISVLAILLGTLLGALVCYMRMSRQKLVEGFARFYISLVRGIPVLVLLMLIFYVIFGKINVNPILAAVLAFGINFAAYVSEMFRTSIESIDKGQTEAGIAGGFTKTQTFIYIVMPQAIRRVLPVYKGELISLVKMTSIVGYIAVQDLTKASDIIRSRTFDAFFPVIMTAVLYFLISWLLLSLLEAVEKETELKRNRPTLSTAKR
jgi:polar amino acid transport system substrate-binding protein